MFVFLVLLAYFILPRPANDLELIIVGVPNVDLSTPQDFNVSKYVGVWYELARYDNFFERGCSCVTAKYTLSSDYVDVLNSCFKDGVTSTASGKAYFTDVPGVLMVQFGPFGKSEYRVVYVDKDYENAIVTNTATSQLWLLSRSYSDENRMQLMDIAENKGLDTSKLLVTGGCNE